jgi:hypothetical protein
MRSYLPSVVLITGSSGRFRISLFQFETAALLHAESASFRAALCPAKCAKEEQVACFSHFSRANGVLAGCRKAVLQRCHPERSRGPRQRPHLPLLGWGAKDLLFAVLKLKQILRSRKTGATSGMTRVRGFQQPAGTDPDEPGPLPPLASNTGAEAALLAMPSRSR